MDFLKYDKDGTQKTINAHTATKYDGDVKNRFLEHFYHGGSIPQFCRKERICRQTLYNWCEKYPEMQHARIMGKLWAEGWWLDQAQENLVTHSSKEGSTKFDSSTYKFIMGGRFGHTGEKELHDLAMKILAKMQNELPQGQQVKAEEAEYELISEDTSIEMISSDASNQVSEV